MGKDAGMKKIYGMTFYELVSRLEEMERHDEALIYTVEYRVVSDADIEVYYEKVKGKWEAVRVIASGRVLEKEEGEEYGTS